MNGSAMTKEEKQFDWLVLYGSFALIAEMSLLWFFNEKCLELSQIALWIGMEILCMNLWLRIIANWFVGCCIRELSYPSCIRWIQKRKKLIDKSEDSRLSNRIKASFHWLNGSIDEACSLWEQILLEEVKREKKYEFFLADGWIAFRNSDGKTLECCSRKNEKYRQIFKSWQAILQKDWSFEWKPLKVTGIRGMDVHNAYWAGFWYMASGNREAAIEKFLYVWRWGDRTELAEKARYALEGWSVELPPQEPVIRNGYKKACALLILFFIFSGVLYVLLANLFGGYVPRIG